MKLRLMMTCVLSMVLISSATAQGTKFRTGVFLRHSTGVRIWGPNGSSTSVPQEISSFNSLRGLTGQNAVTLTELAWPPAADNEWERWHRVFENRDTLVEDIRPILNANRIVIIKSCYTSSLITAYGTAADTLTPTLKTVLNYKWHLRGMLKMMRQRPANFFVLWTNAPLLPSVTNNQQAALSDIFSRWAKDTLAQGLDPQFGPFPANVYVFDYFHKLAGANGKLPITYAASEDDSHPNGLATQLVAPQFVNELFNAAISYETLGTSPPTAPILSSPTNSATGVSTNPVLSWNASSGAASYRLQVSIASDFTSTIFDQTGLTALSRSFSALATSKVHYWRVNATNAQGTSSWSQVWSFTTAGAGPLPPALISPSDSSSGVLLPPIVRWAASTGATSYRLQVSTVPDFSSSVLDQSGLTIISQTLSGLANNRLYYWRVNATSASGTGAWSQVWSFTTIGLGPLPPVLASPADSSNGLSLTPSVTWGASTGATSYRLQVSTLSDFSSTVLDQGGITGTGQTLNGLTNNKLYYWRVNATNLLGTSAWSQIWRFTTIGSGPLPPVLVSPADSSNGVSLPPIARWLASSGAATYRLQVSLVSDFSTIFFDLAGLPGTAQTISGLATNKLYYWRVNATNVSGTGAWSQAWSFTTAGSGPLAPLLTSPSDSSTGVPLPPVVRWAASTGATSYRLHLSIASNFSTTVFDQSGLTTTTQTLNGLANNIRYYWRVNATSASGTGGWSQVWSFLTVAGGPLPPVLASPADSSRGLSLPPVVRWVASSGATSYRLQVSGVSDFSTTVFDQSGLTVISQTLAGLANNSLYFWRVNATNAAGTSGWSQIWDFTTVGIGPLPPALVGPADSSTGVALPPIARWLSSAGATSYRLQVSLVSDFSTSVLDLSALPGTAQTISGLANNRVYFWRVSATNASGTSAWSQVWRFTTAGTGPPAPVLTSPADISTAVVVPPVVLWIASTGATSYRLQVSPVQNFSSTVFDQGGLTATSQTLGGLANGQLYYWRVNAANGLGTGGWSQVWSFTTASVGAPPPVVVAPADSSIAVPLPPIVRWSSSVGALSYRLQVSLVADFSTTVTDFLGLPGTAQTVSGLSNNKLYYWRVNAANASGSGLWSQIWRFTTAGAGPVAPTLMNPADSSNAVPLPPLVSWAPSVGAATYRLQVSIVSDFSTTVLDQGGLSGTTQTLNALANSRQYYWRVNASDASGTGGWSQVWSFTTVGVGPLPPALVGPTDSSTGVSMPPVARWLSSAGATSYRLQVSTASDFSTTILDLSGLPGTAQTVSGLAAGNLYFWHVNATNASGTGAWSPVWSFTTGAVGPSAPVLASPLDGSTGVSMPPIARWLSSTGATSYRLQVSIVSDFSSIALDLGGLPGTAQTASGLAGNRLYYWRVNASNTSGTGNWSQVWKFTTGSVGPPAPVLTGPADGSSGISLPAILRWSSSVGALSYRLQVSSASDFSSVVFGMSNLPGTAQTVSALVNNRLYYWRVNATNTSGTGSWSQVWSFTSASTGGTIPDDGTADLAVESESAANEILAPTEFSLSQNYPNPFNPSTMIRYSVPRTVNVSLRIYNILGQVVATLVDEQKDPGFYTVQWNASVPGGIYFYRLRAGEHVEIMKMTLLK